MKRIIVAALAMCFAAVACGDSVDATSGVGEPLRFGYRLENATHRAQFFAGDIPGQGQGPQIAGIDVSSNETVQGKQGNSGIAVRVKAPAFAVAARLKGMGTGYWVARVSVAEVFAAGELRSELLFDVAPDLPPGKYEIEFAGIDSEKHFGAPVATPITVHSRTASGAVVLSLRWDAPVDLDLQLLGPDGNLLDPKKPTTLPPGTPTDGGVPAGHGARDLDSMAFCRNDGVRQENIVFAAPPAPGNYAIYVNLFDACGVLGTNYEVSILVDGVRTGRFYGYASELEARRGGFALGNFVTETSF
ncbi:hypothetical protein [Pendulispora albinea]|uniref:Uncharacterized protein n=1 Tax=Pendulispora albinea TaxID=2741071 RepID=A0ABZ2LJI4_9BACT